MPYPTYSHFSNMGSMVTTNHGTYTHVANMWGMLGLLSDDFVSGNFRVAIAIDKYLVKVLFDMYNTIVKNDSYNLKIEQGARGQ